LWSQTFGTHSPLFYNSTKKEKKKKIGLLTVVLTILADGESGLQCQVTGGSREIYLKDVEALGFLQEKYEKCKEKNEQ